MTPPCSNSRKLLPHFPNRKPSIESNGKKFSEMTHRLALLPAAPEPQEAGHQCVNEGALVILKDSVRAESLPPCQPAGRMTPPCSGF